MYSISTHCLISSELTKALDTLSAYTKNVEIMSDGPHYLTDTKNLESFNFEYSIHAPSRGVNIASVLEPIRKASVEVITDTFRVAAEVNAGIVIHPGYFAWENDYELSVKHLHASLAQIHAESLQYGVTYYLENMGNWGYFFLQHPKDLKLIEGSLFCLDVGHAHECKSLTEFLQHPFAHVHLHDNDGTTDSHDVVGNGSIDFDAVMKAVKQNKIAHPVIEVGTLEGAVASIEYLTKKYDNV